MKPKSVSLRKKYFIKAPQREIYNLITDFENMPKYFPSVAKSLKYTKREGNKFETEAETKAFLGSKTFKVRMVGELHPPKGFTSTNYSSLGIEHESFMTEEVENGTEINYVNDVEITNPFFSKFSFLIKHVALWYWEKAVFDKMKIMLERKK